MTLGSLDAREVLRGSGASALADGPGCVAALTGVDGTAAVSACGAATAGASATASGTGCGEGLPFANGCGSTSAGAGFTDSSWMPCTTPMPSKPVPAPIASHLATSQLVPFASEAREPSTAAPESALA